MKVQVILIYICKMKNCPSLSYIEKYRNSVTVFEYETIEKSAASILNFENLMRNTHITWEEIENNFIENTYDYAASAIEFFMSGG